MASEARPKAVSSNVIERVPPVNILIRLLDVSAAGGDDDGSVNDFSLFDFFIGASWSAKDDLMLSEVRHGNGILGKSSIKFSFLAIS